MGVETEPKSAGGSREVLESPLGVSRRPTELTIWRTAPLRAPGTASPGQEFWRSRPVHNDSRSRRGICWVDRRPSWSCGAFFWRNGLTKRPRSSTGRGTLTA
jgi:hypothetical protein